MLRPGIVGTRGSIPYGHTTTAVHEMRIPPPPATTPVTVSALPRHLVQPPRVTLRAQ